MVLEIDGLGRGSGAQQRTPPGSAREAGRAGGEDGDVATDCNFVAAKLIVAAAELPALGGNLVKYVL